jgi:hypothetical protein
MADNPLPAKWNEIQMVIDSETKKLRTRSPEDCTVSGAGVAHNKYIVAAPVAVCAQRMLMCRICPRHVLTASRCAWKVSMRGTAKPGRAGANLSVSDFKHSRRLYALCSREAPGVIWLEPLPSKDAAVVAFATRRKDECPDQKYLDHGDTFDAFCSEFNSMEQRALLVMRKQCPLTHEQVGTVYPALEELQDIVDWVQGAQLPPPPAHTHHHRHHTHSLSLSSL